MSLPLASRIRLTFLLALVVAAGVGGLVAVWWPFPWAVGSASALAGVTAGLWLLGRVLGPMGEVLAALRDGVRGFRDRDFSLQLAVRREDELGEQVALYNSVADALHRDRSRQFQKEVLLGTVFQATPMALVLVDPQERIVLANRAAEEVFAMDGSPVGQSFAAILEQCPSALQEALEGGQDALFTVEQAGQEETYHLSRRIFDLNGQHHSLYMVRRLTPELRRREVELWKQLIRLLSHELNNSLAPIASLTRSARQMLGRPEHQQRLESALEVVEERATHLKDFLEGYARFARLPRPVKKEVEWEPFLEELQGLFPFRQAGEPPRRRGYFDPVQLQQVLINLLKNAREAGSLPEATELIVEPTPDGGCRLRVLDRGQGMSDDELRQALLPFFSTKKAGAESQAGSISGPGAAGSGLGLALCREILEAHGGHLRLERRQGGGIEVVCWLPGP